MSRWIFLTSVVLLLDGHSSHYNLEAVTFAKENGIIMFTLVPHTTHKMQPLDTAVYGPMKTNWQGVCHDYIQSHPGKVITKYNFNELFSNAWLKTIIPANIISGFRCCGIYSFNPKEVFDHDPCASENNDVSENDESPLEHSFEGSIVMQQGSSKTENSQIDTSITNNGDTTTFTTEELLFNTQYIEGYNLHDSRYIAWLSINYPEEDHERFLPLIDYFPEATMPDGVPVSLDATLDTSASTHTSVDQPLNSVSIMEYPL